MPQHSGHAKGKKNPAASSKSFSETELLIPGELNLSHLMDATTTDNTSIKGGGSGEGRMVLCKHDIKKKKSQSCKMLLIYKIILLLAYFLCCVIEIVYNTKIK